MAIFIAIIGLYITPIKDNVDLPLHFPWFSQQFKRCPAITQKVFHHWIFSLRNAHGITAPLLRSSLYHATGFSEVTICSSFFPHRANASRFSWS